MLRRSLSWQCIMPADMLVLGQAGQSLIQVLLCRAPAPAVYSSSASGTELDFCFTALDNIQSGTDAACILLVSGYSDAQCQTL